MESWSLQTVAPAENKFVASCWPRGEEADFHACTQVRDLPLMPTHADVDQLSFNFVSVADSASWMCSGPCFAAWTLVKCASQLSSSRYSLLVGISCFLMVVGVVRRCTKVQLSGKNNHGPFSGNGGRFGCACKMPHCNSVPWARPLCKQGTGV